jgi:hypothetical protein
MYCPDCGNDQFDLFGKQQVQARLGAFSVEGEDVCAVGDLEWNPTKEPVEHEFLACLKCSEEWEPDQLLDSPSKEEPFDRDKEVPELVEQVVRAFPSWREAEEEDEYSGALLDEEMDAAALDTAVGRIVYGGRRLKREVKERAFEKLGLVAPDEAS